MTFLSSLRVLNASEFDDGLTAMDEPLTMLLASLIVLVKTECLTFDNMLSSSLFLLFIFAFLDYTVSNYYVNSWASSSNASESSYSFNDISWSMGSGFLFVSKNFLLIIITL